MEFVVKKHCAEILIVVCRHTVQIAFDVLGRRSIIFLQNHPETPATDQNKKIRKNKI